MRDSARPHREPAQCTADQLLFEALELPAEERDAFLVKACTRLRNGQALLMEVKSLLRAHENAGDFLDQPALLSGELSAALDQAGDALHHGRMVNRHVGPYRIVRRIGSGGMGEVYVAQRDDDVFDREVAVKVIRPGLLLGSTSEIVKRFEHERRLLAGLDHPGIARLLDGGSTDAGQPYLIMEYVDGEPLNTFCDARQLSIDARLDLFLAVCDAVQFAHRNLIVHRDLKPANILVKADGSTTSVKLLDFGIAKLLSEDSTGHADETMTIERRLTPAYASPEQVRPREDTPITTASDVYSLGVILYELLTGQRPYRAEATSARDMEQAVCEDPPTRPSDVVRSNGAASVNCGLDPARLQRRLHGDLETIILKALRKEPERRYATVAQLAEDIRRHRQSLPVTARPDTLSYRMNRFIRRHRVGVAAAMLVVLILCGSLVAITSLYVQAERARSDAELAEGRATRRFEQVRSIARTMMFDMHDQIEKLTGATEARALLIATSLEYLDALAQEVGDDTGLLDELVAGYDRMGRVQGQTVMASLGDPAAALESFRKAEATLLRLMELEPPSPERQRKLFSIRLFIARMLNSLGQPQEALAMFATLRADAERMTTADPESPRAQRALMLAHSFLGNQQRMLGDIDAALLSYEASHEIAQWLVAHDPNDAEYRRDAAIMSDKLGEVYLYENRLAEAETAFSRYHEQIRAEVEANPQNAQLLRDLALIHQNLGHVAMLDERLIDAIEQYLASIALLRRIEAMDPADATVQRDLSILYERLAMVEEQHGDITGALEHFRISYDISARLAEDTPSNVSHQVSLAWCGANVAWQLNAIGSYEEARAMLEASLAIIEPIAASQPATTFSHEVAARASEGMVRSLLGLKRPMEAQLHADRMRAIAERRRAAQPDETQAISLLARAMYCLAAVACQAGESAEAHRLLDETETLLQAFPRDHWSYYERELEAEMRDLRGRCRP